MSGIARGDRPSVGVVIITKNEEAQIADCLETVSCWADEIIVVDDCSVEHTGEIAVRMGAKVITHVRIGFDEQRNLGMREARSDWLLHLDADQRVSATLRDEILEVVRQTNHTGFRIRYRNFWLRGYEVRFGGWGDMCLIRLARRENSHWENTIHEKLIVDGTVGELREPLIHLVDISYEKRMAKSNVYTSMVAAERHGAGQKFNLLLMFMEPIARAINVYVRLQGFRDGVVGLFWALHQLFGYVVIHIKLWEFEQADKMLERR